MWILNISPSHLYHVITEHQLIYYPGPDWTSADYSLCWYKIISWLCLPDVAWTSADNLYLPLLISWFYHWLSLPGVAWTSADYLYLELPVHQLIISTWRRLDISWLSQPVVTWTSADFLYLALPGHQMIISTCVTWTSADYLCLALPGHQLIISTWCCLDISWLSLPGDAWTSADPPVGQQMSLSVGSPQIFSLTELMMALFFSLLTRIEDQQRSSNLWEGYWKKSILKKYPGRLLWIRQLEKMTFFSMLYCRLSYLSLPVVAVPG